MYINKKIFIALFSFLFLLALSVILIIVFLPKKSPTVPSSPISPTPTSFSTKTTTPPPSLFTQKENYKNIFPGKSTQEDVINQLGAPIKTEVIQNEEKILYYPTNNNFILNRIYLSKDQNVKYIVRKITSSDQAEAGSYQDFLGKYPKGPSGVVYDPSDNVYKWLVFSNNGFALFVNDSGNVLSIQYFKPMSFDEYKATVVPDLSLSISVPKPQP